LLYLSGVLLIAGLLARGICDHTTELDHIGFEAMERNVSLVMIPPQLTNLLDQLSEELQAAPETSNAAASAREYVEQFDRYLDSFQGLVVLGNYLPLGTLLELAGCLAGLDRSRVADLDFLITICKWQWRYGDSMHLMMASPLLIQLIPLEESSMPRIVGGTEVAQAIESVFVRECVLLLKHRTFPRPILLNYYSNLIAAIHGSNSTPLDRIIYEVDPGVRRSAIRISNDADQLGVGGYRGIQAFVLRARFLASL
jgi:hypothetical protein